MLVIPGAPFIAITRDPLSGEVSVRLDTSQGGPHDAIAALACAVAVVAGECDMPSFGTALEAVRSFAANNPGLLDQARAAASTRRLAMPS